MHCRSLYLNNRLCFLHILKYYYWPTKHRFHCPLLSQPFTQHEAFNLDINSIFQPNKIGTCSHPCFSHMIMAKRGMSKQPVSPIQHGHNKIMRRQESVVHEENLRRAHSEANENIHIFIFMSSGKPCHSDLHYVPNAPKVFTKNSLNE